MLIFPVRERNVPQRQFVFKAGSINFFGQSKACFIEDLKRRAHEPATFLFIDFSFHE